MTGADLEAVQTWLAAQLPGKAVVIGPLRDQPDAQVAIQEYAGPLAPNWQGDYRAQFRCRGALPAANVSSYKEAHTLAEAVRVAVAPAQDNQVVLSLGGGHRARVRLVSVMPLGPDQKGREEFTVNIALETTRV